MGIRESLLNTITSVADSDFVRIVTSAGASSKATLANVMKSFESGLGAKSSLADSDYIRIVGSDNNLYKQSVSDVKNAMGVTKLEGRFPLSVYSGDLTSLTYTGFYPVYDSADLPLGVSIACVQVLRYSPDWITQILYPMHPSGRRGHILIRTYYGGTTWSDWVEQPTRAEIDALNSNLNGVKVVLLSKTVTIPAGSVASPSLTEIVLSDAPANFQGVIAYLNSFQLPYIGINGSMTWVHQVQGKTIYIKNSASVWENYTLYIVGFCK